MTDKKLTDSEIVKALECCTKREHQCCNDGECPLFYKTATYSECRWKLLKGTTDLINRLQAENERLETLNSDLVEIQDIRKKVNLALIAENAELTTAYETAKAEAYKEFAERLESIMYEKYQKYDDQPYPIATISIIDNLLKEMVGDNP